MNTEMGGCSPSQGMTKMASNPPEAGGQSWNGAPGGPWKQPALPAPLISAFQPVRKLRSVVYTAQLSLGRAGPGS